MRYAMIMAGGAGTRLWPMSRAGTPKQLLPLLRRDGGGPGDDPISLLELSAARLDGLVPPAQRYICTGEAYRAQIRAALPAFSDDRILGEPVARDTVNAVGFTAAVLQKLDPAAVFAVLTADHVIEPVETFRRDVDLGFRLVEADPARLVTFSIKPTYPSTAFGYIERGAPVTGVTGCQGKAFRVARYVEKPDIQRAEAYVASGAFSWSSGMFVWKAATVLECIRRFKPEAHAGLMQIQHAWGTPDQQRVLQEVYPTLPKTSVDYAVMEPASRLPHSDKHAQVCTVLMDVNWLDVGSWPSYAQTLKPDPAGNCAGGAIDAGRGAVFLHCKNALAVSSDPAHTIALLGCEDLVVIHTPQATLVMPRHKAEELKALHGLVDERLR